MFYNGDSLSGYVKTNRSNGNGNKNSRRDININITYKRVHRTLHTVFLLSLSFLSFFSPACSPKPTVRPLSPVVYEKYNDNNIIIKPLKDLINSGV